ncbi:MAG: hypothetical protein E6R05_01010 [Candidatus Moraniibacteriota bacterium]|nr:MAG: hypothetical protein E6R05_01010 [Candidatus Moranbacteria bacterium]
MSTKPEEIMLRLGGGTGDAVNNIIREQVECRESISVPLETNNPMTALLPIIAPHAVICQLKVMKGLVDTQCVLVSGSAVTNCPKLGSSDKTSQESLINLQAELKSKLSYSTVGNYYYIKDNV